MSTKHETIRLTVDLSVRAHKRVKTVSALLGMSMSDFVRESIQEKLSKKPNELTRKVFKNTNDLFDDLGI